MKRTALFVLLAAACGPLSPDSSATTATGGTLSSGFVTDGAGTTGAPPCRDESCPGIDTCAVVGDLCELQGLSPAACWDHVEWVCRLSQGGGNPPVSPGYVGCQLLKDTHALLDSGYDPDKVYVECTAKVDTEIAPSFDYCPAAKGCWEMVSLCKASGVPELECVGAVVAPCSAALAQNGDFVEVGCAALGELAPEVEAQCLGLCW